MPEVRVSMPFVKKLSETMPPAARILSSALFGLPVGTISLPRMMRSLTLML